MKADEIIAKQKLDAQIKEWAIKRAEEKALLHGMVRPLDDYDGIRAYDRWVSNEYLRLYRAACKKVMDRDMRNKKNQESEPKKEWQQTYD